MLAIPLGDGDGDGDALVLYSPFTSPLLTSPSFLTGAWKRHGSATSTLSRRRSLGPCGLAPACRRSVYVCTPSHHLVHGVYVYINVYDERYRYSATLLFRVFHHHRAIRRFPSFRPRCHSPRRSRAKPLLLSLSFPPFSSCVVVLCVVTRIRTRASRASLLDKARFLLCPFSPSLFLLIYSILSFYLLIILPRQIVRFAYFLYLSICIPNDFIKRLLSFSRDAFRGIA